MDNKAFSIGKRAFLTSAIILLLLMIGVGILTKIVTPGTFEREIINGREVVISDSFKYIESIDYPVFRWFTAPFEVLVSKDSLVLVVIIIFLIFIGGSVSILNKSGVLSVIIDSAINKFGEKKYLLMAIITLIFMLFGAVIGVFEEVVPMVPVVMALSYRLGWDRMTGLGMSILAAGFGFVASFIEGLSNYYLTLVGVFFLIGGLGSGFLSDLKVRNTLKTFAQGALGVAPASILILMAASIKHIITSGYIMDTILYETAQMIQGTSPFIAVVIVFGLVLIMNFMIGSGSTKAFLVMPIVIPLADLLSVNRQIMVLAFQFGDGFSNCILQILLF